MTETSPQAGDKTMNAVWQEITKHEDVLEVIRRRQKSFADLLRTRGVDLESSGFLRQAAVPLANSRGLALATHDAPEPEVDEAKGCVFFKKITTPATDRYGDIILPRGCLKTLGNYQKNPVVFFGHRSADMPIATATHPSGAFGLNVGEGAVSAWAKFHLSTEESTAVFGLLAKGVLKGTSIGFLPIKASILGSNKDEDTELEERVKKRKEKTPDGEKVITFDPWLALRFLEWDLLEYSVVSTPANPECCESLTRYLSLGHVDGEKIPLTVSKALAPYTLKARVWAHGFDPSTSKYSGTLKMGESELEYENGSLTRIGDFKLSKTPQEVVQDNLNTGKEVTPPVAEIATIVKEITPASVIPAVTKENGYHEDPGSTAGGEPPTPEPEHHTEMLKLSRGIHALCMSMSKGLENLQGKNDNTHSKLDELHGKSDAAFASMHGKCDMIHCAVKDLHASMKAIGPTLEKAHRAVREAELKAKEAEHREVIVAIKNALEGITSANETMKKEIFRLTGRRV